MGSYAADFAGLSCPDYMVISAAAEFAVGSIKRAQGWKTDSVEWEKLRNVFKPFLRTMRQNFEGDFHEVLSLQLNGQQRAVKAELCALMPSLQNYLEAPCRHPVPTVVAYERETTRDADNTDTRKDENYTECGSKIAPKSSPLKSTNERIADTKREGPHPETVLAARPIGAL